MARQTAGWCPFAAVSAGKRHTRAITTYGYASCWGERGISLGDRIAGISAGRDTCWLDGDGKVAGDGSASPDTTPDLYTSASAGDYRTCGLQTDGTAACWVAGQHWKARPAETKGAFQSISVGEDRTCGVRADGRLACWGLSELD